ncbi:MAG: hypothetical protein M1409_10605 [Actinobacteria bacterium]|nr:hypothetical protein [Actinomycetota bacterium]
MALSYGQSYLAALGVQPKTYIPGSYYQAPAPQKPVQALWSGKSTTGGTPPNYTPPAPVYIPPAPTCTPPVTGGVSGGVSGGEAGTVRAGLEVDLAGIWETAGQMADNEINPQLAEIDRLLQEAGYSADESQRAINEAYLVAIRSLQKSIYENMVAGKQGLAAMGTGRGGGCQELLARAGERSHRT